jgi:hypothetical protein
MDMENYSQVNVLLGWHSDDTRFARGNILRSFTQNILRSEQDAVYTVIECMNGTTEMATAMIHYSQAGITPLRAYYSSGYKRLISEFLVDKCVKEDEENKTELYRIAQLQSLDLVGAQYPGRLITTFEDMDRNGKREQNFQQARRHEARYFDLMRKGLLKGAFEQYQKMILLDVQQNSEREHRLADRVVSYANSGARVVVQFGAAHTDLVNKVRKRGIDTVVYHEQPEFYKNEFSEPNVELERHLETAEKPSKNSLSENEWYVYSIGRYVSNRIYDVLIASSGGEERLDSYLKICSIKNELLNRLRDVNYLPSVIRNWNSHFLELHDEFYEKAEQYTIVH